MQPAKIAPPAGPEFDEPHRIADRGVDGRDPAARAHQQHRALEAGVGELALEPAEITPHQRLDVGVGASGGEALVFAHFRRHVGRERHRDVGQPRPDGVADAPLVIRIGEAVQEADCDGLDLLRCQRRDRGREARRVERHQHVAMRVDALAHRKAQPARHQRRRQVDVDVVLLEPILVADLDHVAEALGGEQRGPGALALDDGVGRERRAVHDQVHVRRRDAGLGRDRAQGRDHGFLGCARRGERLRREAAVAHFQRHVRERAADVEAEADAGGGCHTRELALRRNATSSVQRMVGWAIARPHAWPRGQNRICAVAHADAHVNAILPTLREKVGSVTAPQYFACPGVRGNGIASRMLARPVT